MLITAHASHDVLPSMPPLAIPTLLTHVLLFPAPFFAYTHVLPSLSLSAICLSSLPAPGSQVRRGCLHLVDLAGSERLSKSGSNEDPALLREAQVTTSWIDGYIGYV